MISRVVSTLVLVSCLARPVSAAAQAPAEPLEAAIAWLHTQPQPDGGFSNGFVAGSDPATTADAVVAIAAAGEDPSKWNAGGSGPMDSLREAVGSGKVAGPGAWAKVALAAVAARDDPRDFAGGDPIAEVLAGLSGETGLFGGGPYDSALAIQALAAAGEPVPENAVTGLLATRLADGTYSFNGDQTAGAGDSNTTAMAVLALIASGRQDEIAPSLAYFRLAQNDDGGWTYQKPSAFGEATDANSTALVIQALVAAGEDLSAWNDPARALLSLQVPSGAFIFNAANSSENLLATVQAIPALALLQPSTPASALPAGAWFALISAGMIVIASVASMILRRNRAGPADRPK